MWLKKSLYTIVFAIVSIPLVIFVGNNISIDPPPEAQSSMYVFILFFGPSLLLFFPLVLLFGYLVLLIAPMILYISYGWLIDVGRRKNKAIVVISFIYLVHNTSFAILSHFFNETLDKAVNQFGQGMKIATILFFVAQLILLLLIIFEQRSLRKDAIKKVTK